MLAVLKCEAVRTYILKCEGLALMLSSLHEDGILLLIVKNGQLDMFLYIYPVKSRSEGWSALWACPGSTHERRCAV